MENVFDKNYLVDIFQQTQRMKRTLETRQTARILIIKSTWQEIWHGEGNKYI